jgi:hypothetical protein
MKSDEPAEALPKDETTLRFGRFALDLRSGTLLGRASLRNSP